MELSKDKIWASESRDLIYRYVLEFKQDAEKLVLKKPEFKS